MFTSLAQSRVCIVGLGLMGGSLGMALRSRRACRSVIGSDRSPDVCRQAVALGAVDEAVSDAASACAEADIVILAAPARAIIHLVGALGPRLRPGSLLMDIGSTKAAIVQALAQAPAHVQVIGGHPMCGKERAGIAAADADLFQGAVFCLSPLPRTDDAGLSLAGDLARAVGAQPLVIEAERHDRLVAAISHLPYLMATALVSAAAQTAAADPLAWQLAASGFRDTSRLAGSDVDMMLDVIMTNRAAVADMATKAASELQTLAAAVASGDEGTLRDVLVAARDTRRQVYR
jgi:prephenate dehydrogenase